MDVDQDGGINRTEWDKFYNVFLSPFLACHPDTHLQTPIDSAKGCFAKEDWMQHVIESDKEFEGLDRKFRKLDTKGDRDAPEDPVDSIFAHMDRDSNGVINLAE